VSEVAVGRVSAVGVRGLPEIKKGDDVAALVVRALAGGDHALVDGDVVVVSSKIVSKAAGLSRAGARDDVVAEQTVRVVAERLTPRGVTRIVQAPCGVVLAAAGVDASNTEPGTVLVLPVNPDAEAESLRARLQELTGALVGVVISDTAGRPWRDGQVDIAIGAAGLLVAEDFRGETDPYGNLLEVTVRAIADEIASLADLVKGKVDGVPVAVVRGLGGYVAEFGGYAFGLQRDAGSDWFRHGHMEAVRTALGVPPGHGAPPADVRPLSVKERLEHATVIANASPHLRPGARDAPPDWLFLAIQSDDEVEAFNGGPFEQDDPSWGDGAMVLTYIAAEATPGRIFALGALAQRIIAAAWAEGLEVKVSSINDDATGLALRALDQDRPLET